jgi:DNA-binding MltR family transcriptional regulator
MFKGQKKEKNSSSLLDKALGGDQEALELILELKLGSIAGSGYKIIDKLTGIPNYLKEKITDNEFASKVGVDPIRAQRVIDSAGLGSGGPKDTKTLLEHLLLVCNKKKNPASYDIVKSEIQDAMTGVGV